MAENLERQIVDLVAVDRMYVPISSFDGKLERRRPKLAKVLAKTEGFDGKFEGDRAYAEVRNVDKQKSKDMRAGIEAFSDKYPKYGRILNGLIEQKRTKKEVHMYFGINDGRRLTQDDYMNVMRDLGLSEQRAEQFYPVVMEISRNLKRQRDGEERSVLIG